MTRNEGNAGELGRKRVMGTEKDDTDLEESKKTKILQKRRGGPGIKIKTGEVKKTGREGKEGKR